MKLSALIRTNHRQVMKLPGTSRWSRLRWLFPGLALLSPLVSYATYQANLSGDWPTYGNGPAHTGYFPGTLNGLSFVLKWNAPMPNFNISQPAVGGGRVFVTTGWYYGAMYLMSLDAATGQPLKTNNFGSSYSINPPTYDNGSVYLARANDASSQMSSYDAATLVQNWSTAFTSQGSYYMAPVVTNGTVYEDTGYYVELTAYNQANGALRYSVALPGNGCDQWTPAYYGGKIYTWVNGLFTEHDPSNGGRNWTLTNATQNEFAYSMKRTLTVADGRAYFTSTTKLMAVDLATHANLWEAPGAFSGTPSVANGIVYAISNGVVNAYTTNGAFVRTYQNTNYNSFSDQLIVTDDVLIVAGSYGVYIFKLSDGSVQQYISSYRSVLGGVYYGSKISLANNTLFISSGDSSVYAFSAANLLRFTVTNNGSAYGNPSPNSYGPNYVLLNTTVTNTVTSPVSLGANARSIVTGWTGGGSIPASGTTNSVTFVATSDSQLTWNWQTQYWLRTSVASSGTVDVTNSWRAAGEIVTLTATPSNYYHFVNWSGDVSGTSNQIQVNMSAPRTVTANFAENLVTNNVPEWWLAQNNLPVNDSGALADSDGDGIENWKEFRAGTDPNNAASRLLMGTTMSGPQLILQWPSASGRLYRLYCATNSAANFSVIASNIYATPPTNAYYLNMDNPQAFYLIEVQ
jgi:hypothetical protein